MFELTVHFKHEMIRKHFTETSNKVELRINRVRISRARPVIETQTQTDSVYTDETMRLKSSILSAQLLVVTGYLSS